MADAPVILPGTIVRLADGVVLSAVSSGAAAQAVFTVPVGMRCIVTSVQLRDPSTSIAAAQGSSQTMGVQAGFNAGADNVIKSSTNVLNPASTKTATLAAGQYARVGAAFAATDDATAGSALPTMGKAGDTFSVKLNYASITVAAGNTVKCDVDGYLVSP